MNGEWLKLGSEFQVPALLPMLLHLAMAVVLGAAIAARPWRRFMGLKPPIREMIHAQVLIALAGAIVVTVIGDSLARAFGLVGLGGFIRFRTGIRDPRDAAVFFLLIGLGMACGLGAEGVAVVCAMVVALMLMVLDLRANGKERPYLRLTAHASDPLGAMDQVLKVVETMPVVVRRSSLKLDEKELRLDLENPKGLAPAAFQQELMVKVKGLLTHAECEILETIKGPKL